MTLFYLGNHIRSACRVLKSPRAISRWRVDLDLCAVTATAAVSHQRETRFPSCYSVATERSENAEILFFFREHARFPLYIYIYISIFFYLSHASNVNFAGRGILYEVRINSKPKFRVHFRGSAGNWISPLSRRLADRNGHGYGRVCVTHRRNYACLVSLRCAEKVYSITRERDSSERDTSALRSNGRKRYVSVSRVYPGLVNAVANTSYTIQFYAELYSRPRVASIARGQTLQLNQ